MRKEIYAQEGDGGDNRKRLRMASGRKDGRRRMRKEKGWRDGKRRKEDG